MENELRDQGAHYCEPASGYSLQTNSAPGDYGGETYEPGEAFAATDGCNTCTRNDGKVAGTLMACE